MSDEPKPLTEETEDSATATESSPPTEGAEEKQKLAQTVDIRDVGPCKKHIKVSIDRDSINRAARIRQQILAIGRPVRRFPQLIGRVHHANVVGRNVEDRNAASDTSRIFIFLRHSH